MGMIIFGLSFGQNDFIGEIYYFTLGGTSLLGIASLGMGVAACVYFSREKNFDNTKMVIAILLYLLCCGPLVPLGLIFIPAQSE
jgi:hypothetical protein